MAIDVDNRATCSSSLRCLRPRADRPCIYQGIGGETARGIEEGGGIVGNGVECCDGDDEAVDGVQLLVIMW
jgi:hypothetical protein